MYIHEMFKDEARAWAEKRGLAQGLEQGLELGKKEQKKETVLRMLAKGATVEMVAEFLDITEDEVRSYMHMN